MGRPKRAADGGLVYHVLNRANARMTIFEDDEDYAAFEQVLEEAVERTQTRLLAYCVLPNHWHLVIWPREDGELSRFTPLADAYAHATLARSPPQYGQWPRVPRTVQVLSGAGGRAFLHGLSVRRAERVTSESCPWCGTLALGQSASLETWYGEGKVVVGGLALAALAGLGRARQRTANRGGVGGAASLRATRQSVRRGSLVRPDRPPTGTGKHASPPRPPQETRKRFLTPRSFLPHLFFPAALATLRRTSVAVAANDR